MADEINPNLNLIGPEVGGSINTWGGKLNMNFAILDSAVAARILRSGDSMTGALGIIAGSELNPGLFFTGDNTGLYQPAANQLGLSVDGVGRLVLSSASSTFTNNLNVNANLSYTGTLTGGTGVVNIGSGQIYKDAAGRIGVGTTTPADFLAGVFGQAIRGATSAGLSLSDAASTDFFLLYESSNTFRIFRPVVGDVLTISSAGNVGIGTATPAAKLDVSGGDVLLSTNAQYVRAKDASGNIPRSFGFNAANTFFVGPIDTYAGGGIAYGVSSNVTSQEFFTAGTSKVVIDSAGNLLVGTPTNNFGGKFVVQDPTNAKIDLFRTDGVAGDLKVRFYDGLGNSAIGQSAGNLILFAGGVNNERFRIDSAGNAGLGVTPKVWGGVFAPGLDIGSGAGISGAVNGAWIFANSYFPNNVAALYKVTGAASYYEQTAGLHKWHTAPSGTAGNPITFTQAMTLFQSGNLNIGGTRDAERLVVTNLAATSTTVLANTLLRIQSNGSGADANIQFADGVAFAANIGMQNGNIYVAPNGSQRALFTTGGYFKASNTGVYINASAVYHEFRSDQNESTLYVSNSNVGSGVNNYISLLEIGAAGKHAQYITGGSSVYEVLANGNVLNANNSYGALSDSKLKNVIGNAPSYWDKYKLIQWVKYTLKADDTNQEMLGVIAQQTREVFPGLIQETPDMVDVVKTREVTKTVPVTRTETQETTRTEIVFENGEYVQKTITESKEVQVPVFDEFDLKNEAGEVIGTHKVPRTETITETEEYTEKEPNGEVTLSVKYSILGHIADVVLQEAMARIEALEAK